MVDVSGIPNYSYGTTTGLFSQPDVSGYNAGMAASQANNNSAIAAGAAANAQAQLDWARTNPASGYGKVYIGPSFGEAQNYGGQNDPFSGGYSPGNRGYSGRSVNSDVWSQGAPAFEYGGTADIDWSKAGSQGTRPSLSVWHEGAPAFQYGGQADTDWWKSGSQGDRPSDLWSQNAPDYNKFGGQADTLWAQSGSQGERPSFLWDYNAPDYAFGGTADTDWVRGGSQGLRPSDKWADTWQSTPSDPQNTFGGKYDQAWVQGGSMGLRPSTVADWGDVDDQRWVQGGSIGIRPSLVTGWGGRDDQAWVQGGSMGLRPSMAGLFGEIGRGATDFSSQNRNLWGAGTSSFDDYGSFYDDTTGGSNPTGNYDAFKNTTYRDPWIAAIPEKFRTNETVDAMKSLAQQYGWDPAALANVIQMETQNSRIAGQKGISPESLWNTLTQTKSYNGLTQMGRPSFTEMPDGRLNGLTYEEYKRASPAQQIKTYGAWLQRPGSSSGSAANLVLGGIGSLPVEDQAAIMMATQFGPYAKSWVSALGEGNENVRTPPPKADQAEELRPWTISAMRDAMAAQMMRWPQTQSPWPLK
jgi:hypothetical protein